MRWRRTKAILPNGHCRGRGPLSTILAALLDACPLTSDKPSLSASPSSAMPRPFGAQGDSYESTSEDSCNCWLTSRYAETALYSVGCARRAIPHPRLNSFSCAPCTRGRGPRLCLPHVGPARQSSLRRLRKLVCVRAFAHPYAMELMGLDHRAGEKLRASPGEPIHEQPGPLAHSRIQPSQPIADRRKWPPRIRGSARAPIDRIRLCASGPGCSCIGSPGEALSFSPALWSRPINPSRKGGQRRARRQVYAVCASLTAAPCPRVGDRGAAPDRVCTARMRMN